MDADMSHPPEKIPDMVDALTKGHDFAVGSRYIQNASTDEEWGLFRWINSKVATLLAYPLTTITDPMSGFFALKKETVNRASYLNPVGYKIGLELLVKCHCQDVKEVPIHFSDRKFGKSKMRLLQQLQYLQHLRRLYIYKYAEQSHIAQFIIVGLTGVLVNLFTLTLLLLLGTPSAIAVTAGIGVSLVSNFFLNKRFTFSYARNRSVVGQFLGFAAACSIGASLNLITAISLINASPLFSLYPQLAALCGIAAGMTFNYLLNRFLVFKKDGSPKT